MFITHRLKKGETFATVMKKHGVTDWKTTWDLKQNKALKARRRTADRVGPGDELVLLDAKAKLWKVEFLGTTYCVPEDDWEALKKDAAAVMKKKFLPPLLKLKKAYDDDHDYMWNLANGSGALVGAFAVIVEAVTRAKPPTAEMSEVSAAVLRLTKAMNGSDHGKIALEIANVDAAMKAYVEAAEDYRRKMCDGATKGVEYVELVRDKCFILAGALASGGASLVLAGAVHPILISAAMGAATELVKVAGDEVGQHIAGNHRSAGTIAFRAVKDAMFAAATSAVSGSLRESGIGQEVKRELTKRIIRAVPGIVGRRVKGRVLGDLLKRKTLRALDDDAVAEVVAKTIMRVSATLYLRCITEKLSLKTFSDAFLDGVRDAVAGLGGGESLRTVGEIVAGKMEDSGIADEVVDSIIADHADAIEAALDKAEAKQAA